MVKDLVSSQARSKMDLAEWSISLALQRSSYRASLSLLLLIDHLKRSIKEERNYKHRVQSPPSLAAASDHSDPE